jgi:hypothetical protein
MQRARAVPAWISAVIVALAVVAAAGLIAPSSEAGPPFESLDGPKPEGFAKKPRRTPTPTPLASATATNTTAAPPTATPTNAPQATATATATGGACPYFPPDNIWNTRIDSLPVDPNSTTYVNTIGATRGLKADFGSGLWDGGPIGIPYTTVPGTQPLVPVSFYYPDESDPGPYPIPTNAPIEGGPNSTGDRHVLVVDRDHCILYEMFDSQPQADGSWESGSGARFDLSSHALRPAGWTSADAAGFAIKPGLVDFDEVASGEIRHAIRFTVPQTRRAYIWPARHYASTLTGSQYPPMGARFRLKAGFNIAGYSTRNQVILTALKRYGMFLADNGSAWYISGVPDERWDNDELRQLLNVTGANFEMVDESGLMIDPNSGQALQSP